MLDGVIHAPLK